LSALDNQLSKGEVVLYRTRCYWFGGGVVFAAIMAVSFFAVMPLTYNLSAIRSDPDAEGRALIGSGLLLMTLLSVGMHTLSWWGTETAITNMSVPRVTGSLQFDDTTTDDTSTKIALKDIEDIHVEQNDLPGGMLGYGAIVIKAPAKYGRNQPPTNHSKKVLGKTLVITEPGKYGPQRTADTTTIFGKTFVERRRGAYSPQPTGDSVEIILGKIPHPEEFCALVRGHIGRTPSGMTGG
jgi:hypothetical protein